jgi:hypothetical protein
MSLGRAVLPGGVISAARAGGCSLEPYSGKPLYFDDLTVEMPSRA